MTLCRNIGRRTTVVLLLALLTALVVAGRARVAQAADEAAARPAEVLVGGVVAFRFSVPHQGVLPGQRAGEIYRRVWRLIDTTPVPERDELARAVRVGQARGSVVVTVGNSLIVTIDEQHARINGGSPLDLAQVWADNLRRGLESYVRLNAPVAGQP